MRIRSALLNKWIGVAGAGLLLGWRETLNLRIHCADPRVNPGDDAYAGSYLYAAWHEAILAFAFFGMPAFPRTQVLISQHQDGEYITQIVRRLRAQVARGSTTRGGRAGLLEMVHAPAGMHLAITPDGPRGPRRCLQPGAVFLASRTRLPIVPVGFGFERAWRARSWDRFAVPYPGSTLTCVAGRPVEVPASLGDAAISHWRSVVEAAMLDCTRQAEQWAAGELPPPSARRAA